MDLLLFIVLTWRLIGCYRPHMDSTIIVSYRIVSVAGPSLSSRGLSPTPLIGNYRIVIYLAIILSYLILNFPAMPQMFTCCDQHGYVFDIRCC